MNKVIEWAKSHKWEAGGLVFIGAVIFFLITRGGSSNSASGPSANLSAYLAAETAQNQYDNAASVALAQTQASTTQAGIAAQEQVDVNNTWAASDLAQSEGANQTSISNNLITQFGTLANNLGTVLTSGSMSSSSSSSGGSSFLWGLFGNGPSASQSQSGSQSQTFVANSQQANAEAELAQIANENFHVGH